MALITIYGQEHSHLGFSRLSHGKSVERDLLSSPWWVGGKQNQIGMFVNPVVSVILPTFNRASFLPEAIEAIKAQECTEWELVIVDDGSTDSTSELIPDLTKCIVQPVKYISQENRGAYGARNTGLDHASGDFVAFYDSDDTWLPHHLKHCVDALQRYDDVDWVYGSCSINDIASGKVLAPDSFHVDARPRPFMELECEPRGSLRVIVDETAAPCALLHGLYAGLQNSVIRSTFFKDYRFEAELRNEAEDQVVVVKALLKGLRFAYFDDVHVRYHIHDENSSAVGTGGGIEKKKRVVRAMIEGFEQLLAVPNLTPPVSRALRQRLGREYFWNLGYALLWQNGERDEASVMFRHGLRFWPWDWRSWKTFFLSRLRRMAKS